MPLRDPHYIYLLNGIHQRHWNLLQPQKCRRLFHHAKNPSLLWEFSRCSPIWSDLPFPIVFDSPFPIGFDSPFIIRFVTQTFSHVTQFYYWFESHHSSPSWFVPQGVPYSLECPDEKTRSGIVEYLKILKTYIAFGKEIIIFLKKR